MSDRYTTPCAGGSAEFESLTEALVVHAAATGDGCWRSLLTDAADEIERLRDAMAAASEALAEASDVAGHARSCSCLACVTTRFLTVALEGATDDD